MIKFLLFMEGVFSFPFFFVIWLIGAVYHGAKAGWTCSAMKDQEKTQFLKSLFSREARK